MHLLSVSPTWAETFWKIASDRLSNGQTGRGTGEVSALIAEVSLVTQGGLLWKAVCSPQDRKFTNLQASVNDGESRSDKQQWLEARQWEFLSIILSALLEQSWQPALLIIYYWGSFKMAGTRWGIQEQGKSGATILLLQMHWLLICGCRLTHRHEWDSGMTMNDIQAVVVSCVVVSCGLNQFPSLKAWVACHYERRLKRPDSWPLWRCQRAWHHEVGCRSVGKTWNNYVILRLPRRMLEGSKACYSPNSYFTLFPCICFDHFRPDGVRHNSAKTFLLHSKVRTTCRDLSAVVLLTATGCCRLSGVEVQQTADSWGMLTWKQRATTSLKMWAALSDILRRSVLTGFQSFGERQIILPSVLLANQLRFHATQP